MSASSPPSHQPGAQFSERFTPPQSAQPYRSMFGSSSRNVDVDFQPYPEEDDYHQRQDEERLEQEGEEDDEERDEIEDVLNENLPPMADDSDDATYEGSDEDEDVVMSDGDGDREQEAGDRDRSRDHEQLRDYSYEDDLTRKEKRKGKQSVRASYDYDYDSTYPPYRSSPPPSSPPSYRPNRYHGPASTWRFWTQEERQNAEALENIRARDLSAHLFNAYALRKRARELRQRSVEENRPHYHRDEDEDAPFAPPARWTAWPMPANEVPRADEYARMMAMEKGDEDEKWTLRMQPDLRPSADLEENLIAVMMRIAKERFRAREWMYGGGGGEASQKKDPSQFKDEEDGAGDATRKNTYNDEEEGESGWKTDPDLELHEDNVEYRPVVSTDDDKSRRQLRPLARQIIMRLDNLLMGLHNARKASMAPDDSSASEMMTDTESVASSRYISPRKRRRTEGAAERSQSRGRKRTRTGPVSGAERMESPSDDHESEEGSAAATSFDESNTSSRASRCARRYGSYQRLRLGLRDWSDVLGIASMMGWPSAAVMRAARRCADLFGEDMVFHTLEEGSVQRVQVKGGRRGERVWQYIEGVEEEEKEQKPPRSQPAPSVSRSRSRARPVSAKRDDVSTTTTAAAAKDKDVTEIVVPDSRRGSRSRRRTKEDLVCPVKKCPRHVNGFSRTWNLNLHLKRVHPGLYSSRGVSGAGTGGESNPDEGNATTEQEQEAE
ncbi:hypothetical protein VTN00DRAFT_8391 [Thermoascus crustaceus]|uniref:uncharacterized protein n=1 Tax=Thermoascus crustaceus TaxID=5088 RepID=UPI0037431A08